MQGPIGGCTQLFNLQLHFLRFSNAYNLKVSSFRLASGRRIGHWEAPVERLGLLFQAQVVKCFAPFVQLSRLAVSGSSNAGRLTTARLCRRELPSGVLLPKRWQSGRKGNAHAFQFKTGAAGFLPSTVYVPTS